MCKICWELTLKTPEQSHWRHSGIFTLNTFFTLCSNDFSVSIDFQQVKSWIGSRSHLDVALLLFVRNIYGSQRRNHLVKWCFFAKIVYRITSLTILARSSILRSVTGCWICLGYFFRFTFIVDLFSSPNIYKY